MDFYNGIILLHDKKMRLSNPIFFNDPFDCRVSVDDNDNLWKLDMRARNGAFGYRVPSKALEYNALIEGCVQNKDREQLKDYRMLCFSGEVNQYQDVLMWGHYGDSHKGIKITFNEVFYNFIKENYKFKPICYSNNRITIKYTDNTSEIKDKIIESMFCKSKIWHEENEHRMVYDINENSKHIKNGNFYAKDSKVYSSEYLDVQSEWIKDFSISCNIDKNSEDIIRKIAEKEYAGKLSKARLCVVNYALHYEKVK
jgi:hypothetical protein